MLVISLVTVLFSTLTALISVGGVIQPVEVLPWGIDEPLSFFSQTVHDITYYMPWMLTVWKVILIGLTVKISLFFLQWALFALKLARGG